MKVALSQGACNFVKSTDRLLKTARNKPIRKKGEKIYNEKKCSKGKQEK